MIECWRQRMISDHAVDRDLQRHRHQYRDWDGKYPEQEDPAQMGITWLGQPEQALKKEEAIGMRTIWQCRSKRPDL